MNNINELKNILGADLLSFILGVSADQLDQMTPNNIQAQALSKLEPCVNVFKGQSEFERPLNIAQSLCTYNDELKTSWAIYLHYLCTGTNLPNFDSVRDSAERNLMTVARDTYPSLLIKRDRFGLPTMFTASYTHPNGRQFNADVLRSRNPIRKLFPDAKTYRHYKSHPNDIFSLNRNMILSNGHGGTVSAGMVLESILSSSVYLSDGRHDPVELYCLSAQENYQRLRKTAGRNLLKIKTIIGLSNVELSHDIESCQIASNINIRKFTPIDKSAVLNDVSEPTMIVEIANSVTILDNYLMSDEDPQNPFARYEAHKYSIDKFYAKQQKDLNKVRLAMLLSSTDELIAPGYIFTTALSPIGLSRSSSVSPYRRPTIRYDKQIIDDVRAKLVRKWMNKLDQLPDTLDVSVRRLISAATERIDDADAFIDAVMVWENLFGAKQETTLRIKGAMSLLIEPKDKARRKDLLKEISTLYDKRSRLVHGSPKINTAAMSKDRVRSIELALIALKLVLNSKNLLHASDSETRGQTIMFKLSA